MCPVLAILSLMSNAPPASARLDHTAKQSWLSRLRRRTPAALGNPAPAANSAAPASDAAEAAAEAAATGVLNLQVWADQAPWRPAGLWAFAAGLLASGALRQPGDLNWQALALLALLVDPLWGGIWRLAGGRRALLALPPRPASAARFALPYMQDGSPAARLLRGDHTDVWPSAVRVGLPIALLALAVAALLGVYAVGLTLLLLVLAALGWTLRRTFGDSTALLHSLAAIGLPWLLTVQQAGEQMAQGGGQADTVRWLPQFLLAGFWVLHQWGGLRNSRAERQNGAGQTGSAPDWFGLLLMAAAQIGMCSLLIAVQSPLWLAPLALLLLPNWLLAWQGQSLRRLRPLWLAAMLVSAAALGQTAGL